MTTYNAIALVDLDDTLFQTLRKCPSDLHLNALTPMAFSADGKPISYATPAQMNLIRWLEETTLFVPVTARSTNALYRTELKFDLAVAAHGAVILNRDGQNKPADASRDMSWHNAMESALGPHLAALQALEASILAFAKVSNLRVRTQIVTEHALAIYLVVKHQDADGNDPDLMAATEPFRVALHDGWTLHMNGNNVAFMPPGLGKASAVAELLTRLRQAHPGLPVIGAGDSHTDLPFMRLCDFMLTPPNSQIALAMVHDDD